MSNEHDRVLQLYRLMAEHEGGDMEKAIQAWMSAQRVFERRPEFANVSGNLRRTP
jgi:hypothetical protein